MKHKEHFDLEVQKRVQNELRDEFVVPFICHSESDELAKLWGQDLVKLRKWCRYEYGLVMPAAQRNLMVRSLWSRL